MNNSIILYKYKRIIQFKKEGLFMNEKIVRFLKSVIDNKGIKYIFISKNSGISYQRLMRIFNQNAIISESELICLCKLLEVKQSELMELLESIA